LQNECREVFHVTTSSNYEKIRQIGLMPQIGPRSATAKECTAKIYFFVDRDVLEEAVLNWLGDEFEEEEELVELKITDNADKFHCLDNVQWEVTTTHRIKPSSIELLRVL